jgi:hypothetical protein
MSTASAGCPSRSPLVCSAALVSPHPARYSGISPFTPRSSPSSNHHPPLLYSLLLLPSLPHPRALAHPFTPTDQPSSPGSSWSPSGLGLVGGSLGPRPGGIQNEGEGQQNPFSCAAAPLHAWAWRSPDPPLRRLTWRLCHPPRTSSQRILCQGPTNGPGRHLPSTHTHPTPILDRTKLPAKQE